LPWLEFEFEKENPSNEPFDVFVDRWNAQAF